MRWRKLGLIFRPDSRQPWAQSHAQLPTPVQIGENLYRVYCASRDASNHSHVMFFDINLDHPTEILRVSDSPVLTPGPLGCFDDHGIYPASAVWCHGKLYLYTIGWNPGIRPPLFYSSIGLAVSEDGGNTFEKFGNAPILARSKHDPCLVTSPFVLKEEDLWRMWYVSGYRWEKCGDELRSYYHIKYAESDDGLSWIRTGRICIDHQNPHERNIARASIIRSDVCYQAWYSFRSTKGYRIGYAESADGLAWTRKDDEVGIDRSDDGWDSEAMAYPFIIFHAGRHYMFYNGNGFGRDGVGLAISE